MDSELINNESSFGEIAKKKIRFYNLMLGNPELSHWYKYRNIMTDTPACMVSKLQQYLVKYI